MKKILQRKHSDIMRELRNPQQHPELALVDWDTVEKRVGPDQSHSELWRKINGHDHASNLARGDVDEKIEGSCTLSKRHLMGRYLMKLRSSYSSQLQMGLLTPIAYSSILRALKTAIDHCNDHRADGCVDLAEGRRKWRDHWRTRKWRANVSSVDVMFEWGWLQVSG